MLTTDHDDVLQQRKSKAKQAEQKPHGFSCSVGGQLSCYFQVGDVRKFSKREIFQTGGQDILLHYSETTVSPDVVTMTSKIFPTRKLVLGNVSLLHERIYPNH